MKYKTWKNRLIGEKIDSIIVLKDTGKRKNRNVIWLCKCNCGEYVEFDSTYLKRKDRYKACRTCNKKLKSNKCREVNIKHGHSSNGKISRTYSSWASMLDRCRNCNFYYKDIEVCERWYKFENFLADMGERPSKEYTIDRIYNNKGYYKENCRWATKEEQAQNRKHTLRIEEVKEIKILLSDNKILQKDIAKMFDVYPSTIDWIKKGETWKNI